MKDTNRYPKGWNLKRVRKVIAHYEGQTDAEAIAEDEAAHRRRKTTFIEVPVKMVPQIQRMLAKSA
jgi:hypothetical protein